MLRLTIKELAQRTGQSIPAILLGVLKGVISDEMDKNPESLISDDLWGVTQDTSSHSLKEPTPEQFDVISRELKTRGLYHCECCDELFGDSYVITHHWYEPPDYRCRAAIICMDCKPLLTPKRLWQVGNMDTDAGWMEHVLPSFDLQRMSIRAGERSGIYLSFLESCYNFPLTLPWWRIAELSL